MSYPWHGKALRLSAGEFEQAAVQLGCEAAAVRAVWEVECAGSAFRRDKSLARRFEPHHMPGAKTTWRDSLKIKQAKRDALFLTAFERNPEAACRATSWGGPQIMGFNAGDAGFDSALEMVRVFAGSEAAQLQGFVSFCLSKGLATHLRAKNWTAFARMYNGKGRVKIYAARMESAYRRHSGQASPVVLREGARGASVRRLQRILGLAEDGLFGPATTAALRRFQADNNLPDDGIAGARTWSLLEVGGIQPPHETSLGELTGKVSAFAGAATAASASIAAVGDALPDQAMTILTGCAGAGLVIAALAFAFLTIRKLA